MISIIIIIIIIIIITRRSWAWESQRVRSEVAKRQVQDLAGVSDTAQREVEPYFAVKLLYYVRSV